ncbi:hypothetical protein C5C18_11945 [Rathayibacter tritici]|uniref:hypothetical protein n=1 Tax=Rathayibacter tritici TaxID=33888 RepID=UPI000CE89041|nr:hypothetical protein [Rathayibacter tritici]PPF66145.1 hypothetical protein C5C21_09650 [Rathayibacter tritici]PPG05990.1 hypothetical protein C5C18_11945 [Rathayibacter tritici]
MVHPTNLSWTVEREARDGLDVMARRAHVSSAVFFERLVEHAQSELTDDGLPSWWRVEPILSDEELPITPD